MNSFTDFLSSNLYQWSLDSVIAIAILVAFLALYLLTQKPLRRLLSSQHVDDYLVTILVGSFYKSVLIIIAVITALSQLGINVIAAMTGFGIAGIAIGFAAKDTLGNIIAGFMILWDKPFVVGDWVHVEEHFGQVQAITMRTTRIHTRNNFHVVIPNQNIINNTVINHHHDKQVRCLTYFYVPYGTNLDKAQTVLLDAANGVEKVLDEPRANTGVTKIENGLVEIVVLTWTENARRAIGMRASVRAAGITALNKNGFSAPYPVTLSSAPKIKKVR